MEVLDKIGQPIVEGSIIAYSIMEIQSPGIRIGKVIKISAMPSLYRDNEQEYKIVVHAIDMDWSDKKLALMDRRSVIHFPTRTVVLSREQVSDEYKHLLDKVNMAK